MIMKALESCNSIVASSLKHPRWLRRTLQGHLPQPDLESAADSSNETESSPETDANTVVSDGLFNQVFLLLFPNIFST